LPVIFLLPEQYEEAEIIMKLKYEIKDKPKGINLISLALQQMLAILAATTTVPMVVGNGMTPAAAMFGAGAGTIVYLLMTRRASPMFLGSSFSFLGSMAAAFAGGVSMSLGMLGVIIGAAAAGLVYVILALIIRLCGVKWIDKLMPPVVIGPTVAVIGLSLASTAVGDLRSGNVSVTGADGTSVILASPHIAILCGLVTLAVTVFCSVYCKGLTRLIPFLIGILSGYAFAAVLTFIGNATEIDALKIIDFGVFTRMMLPDGTVSLSTFISVPEFSFIKAINGVSELNASYIITVITAYVPVSFVGFAEHIADHKNLSSIVNKDLLTDPGLEKTLLGDGLGSITGAFFGGCPNATYGESIACVALTGNASTVTIFAAATGCILMSFLTPFVAFVSSIPNCVMGGLCVALYGFIAISGLKMIQRLDFDDNRNIFVIAIILITGIGGLSVNFGSVTVTEVATALILGILTNLLISKSR